MNSLFSLLAILAGSLVLISVSSYVLTANLAALCAIGGADKASRFRYAGWTPQVDSLCFLAYALNTYRSKGDDENAQASRKRQ